MKQVEIVRKTREFFEDTGVVPHPDWIDPPGTWVVNLAGMLGRMPWKDLPERFQHSRGFFTSITGSRIRSWVSCFWNSLFWVGQDLFRRPPTSAEVDNLAERFNILTGMWLVSLSSDKVDNLWERIVESTLAGTLGISAKVSTRDESEDLPSTHVFCVYNADYRSMTEVSRVRDELWRLGVTERILYKPEILTHRGIWGIRA